MCMGVGLGKGGLGDGSDAPPYLAFDAQSDDTTSREKCAMSFMFVMMTLIILTLMIIQ